MWIAMAIGTLSEIQAAIARLIVWPRSVALLASYLRVQSREWIASLRMIKLLDINGFPVDRVVALRAVVAKPALMRVLVTAGTG